MPTVNLLEAKSNLSRLVEAVETGAETEIVIARNGRPAARLVPIAVGTDASRRIGLMDGRYPSMSLDEFNANDAEVAALFHRELK